MLKKKVVSIKKILFISCLLLLSHTPASVRKTKVGIHLVGILYLSYA